MASACVADESKAFVLALKQEVATADVSAFPLQKNVSKNSPISDQSLSNLGYQQLDAYLMH